MRRVALIASLLLPLSNAVPAGAAKNHDPHRRAPHAAASALLRVPQGEKGRGGLLDGRMLALRGQQGQQGQMEGRPSPLAVTKTLIRALKRGVLGGTMKTDSADSSKRLTWTAGGVPMTSLPTNSSLLPYNCHVADRLPGDPASIYRFTVLSIRF